MTIGGHTPVHRGRSYRVDLCAPEYAAAPTVEFVRTVEAAFGARYSFRYAGGLPAGGGFRVRSYSVAASHLDLYVVYDGGVQQLTFTDEAWTQASVATTTAVPTGLTSLTEAAGELYAVDSEVFRVLYLGQAPELPFSVLRVDPGLF